MAISITYFGSGTLFGSDTLFGYTTDSDSFPTDVVDDVDSILLEAGAVYQVQRDTVSVDGLGNAKTISNDYFNVYGLIQDITLKDRQIHSMGLAVKGNKKGFFLPSYHGGSDEVKEGDILTDADGVQWRIVQIVGDRRFSTTTAFRVVVMENIFLQGSS